MKILNFIDTIIVYLFIYISFCIYVIVSTFHHLCDQFKNLYTGVSSVFYFVATISFVQLLICCVSEYYRMKQPSILHALHVTTPKLLYFVIFIAALLRGAYFTTPVSLNVAQQKCIFQCNSLFIPFLGSTTTSLGVRFDISLLSIALNLLIVGRLPLGRGVYFKFTLNSFYSDVFLARSTEIITKNYQ